MCCVFTLMLFLGPRVADVTWWLLEPARWNSTFGSAIWPILGIIFLPWTTLIYVIVAPGGVDLLGWIFLALGVFSDIAMHAGGTYANRDKVPGMSSTESAESMESAAPAPPAESAAPAASEAPAAPAAPAESGDSSEDSADSSADSA